MDKAQTKAKIRKLLFLTLTLVISVLIFFLVFGLPGRLLSELTKGWLSQLTALIPSPTQGARLFVLHDLAYSGIVPILITFLGFLPQLLILFSCIEAVRHLKLPHGLNSLLLGFGCTTIAISAIEKEESGEDNTKEINKTKSKTLLMSFIPCSAKIPVLLIFVTGFFQFSFFTIYLLYAACLAIGFAVYALYCKRKELNPLHFLKHESKQQSSDERAQNIFRSIGRILLQTLLFFKRLGLPLLIGATLIYFLSHYTFSLNYTDHVQASILYRIADFISPIFSAIGLGNAVAITVLIFGLLGKEMIATALVIMATAATFTYASALAFLAFVMLYPTCLNAFFAARKKISTRFAFFVALINFLTAYVVAGFIYWFF